MGQFATLAQAELDEVTVTIGSPFNFPGGVWNDGEHAWVTIDVTNSSTVTLRDVVADTHVSGQAAIDPLIWWGHPFGDGQVSWDEIDPGGSVTYYVRMLGTRAGNAHMWVGLSAEIVPYASDWHVVHAFFNVTGA